MKNIFDELSYARKNDKKAALCIVVNAKGSAPGKPGAKMIVYDNGKIFGSIGGGNLEKKVIENALEQIKSNEPKLFRHDLLHQHNMCCGGSVDIYIEPIVKSKQLYIFGAGHIGKALAKLASPLQFEVFIIDDRKKYLDQLEIEEVKKMNAHYDSILPSLSFNEHTFIVIATYEHAFDRAILSYCIKQPFAYLGMIGSERKIAMTKKMFIEGGMAGKEELSKVDMPMGLDINAETPDEIAISVLAKLIKVKNNN